MPSNEAGDKAWGVELLVAWHRNSLNNCINSLNSCVRFVEAIVGGNDCCCCDGANNGNNCCYVAMMQLVAITAAVTMVQFVTMQ